jgi:TM2 domain-containing membrane protein YozV
MIVPLRLKSTTIAAVLSLLLAGTGQIYTGRTARGLGIMALLALIGFAGYSVYSLLGLLLVIPYILGIFAWQVYDAYNLAKKYNEYTRTYTRPPW